MMAPESTFILFFTFHRISMGGSRGGSGRENMGGSGANLCGGVMRGKQVVYLPGMSCEGPPQLPG